MNKAGDTISRNNFNLSRNFLATDEVPDSLFGFKVVSRPEDYLDSDRKFFNQHPRAGGFYDLEGESAAEE